MAIQVCLWFNDNAEEAVDFYMKVFRDGTIHRRDRYDEVGGKQAGKPAGSLLAIEFEIEGQRMLAINGGPHYSFSEATSLMVFRESQDELDELWAALTSDGEEIACGWCKDPFGVTWQVLPRALQDWITGPDPAGRARANEAMLTMGKLEIDKIRAAYESAESTAVR